MDKAKKLKEWYQWGKDAYKSTAKMMQNNSRHPDYDSKEKRDAIHDKFGESYLLEDKGDQRLIEKFGYTPEFILECKEEFRKGYASSRAWYAKADKKYQAILDSYKPIFEEAEKIAHAVDVSDIRDGFPCGSCHLYLQKYPETEALREALAHFNGSRSTDAYKYSLPIKFSGVIMAGAIGLLKNPHFKFDPEAPNVDDYLICGINAYYYRKALIDTRFCAVPLKTFHNEGGLSEYRSLETEKHDTVYLRKKFGEALNIKKNTAKAKVYHQYQRTLTIPF